MDHVVILDGRAVAEEENYQDVGGCEYQHLQGDSSFPKNRKEHYENNSHVKGMLGLLREGKVLIAERIDHQHPFVKILRYRLSIPPILIVPPLLQLQNLSHCQHYILHYQIVKTHMLKENERRYFEEKLR